MVARTLKVGMIGLASEGYGLTIIRSDWLGGSACLASLAGKYRGCLVDGPRCRDSELASQRQRPSIGLPARHVVQGSCLICYVVGGTGLGSRDITVETLQPLLKREIPGLMEAARAFGQKRTPYAALSRGVAGYIDRSLVITLPGSRGGASESMAAILPALVHLIDVSQDLPHAQGYQ